MVAKIREHVDFLFQTTPPTARALELKEELIANLTDKYQDLIQRGETEETAYHVVIAGIGDVEELIRGLRETDETSPQSIQLRRQTSAIRISIAVGLYIISLIFPIFFGFLFGVMWVGIIFMFLCWGGATALLVYNALSMPAYVKAEETLVEDFKEWKSESSKRKTLYNSIQSLVWSITVPLYLVLGFFWNAWHPGWLVFVLAPLVNTIIRLIFAYREEI